MGARESREARHTRHLIGLLGLLPVEQLVDVLDGVDAVLKNPPAAEQARTSRRCSVCGWGYVRCREIAGKTGDDHTFEALP